LLDLIVDDRRAAEHRGDPRTVGGGVVGEPGPVRRGGQVSAGLCPVPFGEGDRGQRAK
jgi:hypothetical protein